MVFHQRIDWADLDLFGHVNNVAFFRYVQAARVEYCEKIGLTSLNNNERLSFMVASSLCRFKKPLYFPGVVSVTVHTAWMKNSSFQLNYTLLDQDGKLCAEAEDVIVVFDHHQKTKSPITEELKARISAIDKKNPPEN
jgi:acyl-CoA thioester hydrolase